MSEITPQQRIEAEVKAAMKAGEKERLSTLRMLLAEIKNERTKPGAGEVDEAGFASLVRKAIKRREEAAVQFRTGGREESALKEESEGALLRTYLPASLGDDEIRAAIVQLIDERGLSGPSAIGPIMKELPARLGPGAESSTISRIAREVLAPAK